MSLFGRLRNLTRGVWLTRSSDKSVLYEEALDAELEAMRPAVRAQRPTSVPEGVDETPSESSSEGPDRDDKGNIVKTL